MFTEALNLFNEFPKIKEFSEQNYLFSLIPFFIIIVIFITYLANMSSSFLKLFTLIKESTLIVSLTISTVVIVIFDVLIAYLLFLSGEIIHFLLRLFPQQFSLSNINSIIEQLPFLIIALSTLLILISFTILLLVYMSNDALILHNLRSVSSNNLEVFRQKNENRLEYYDHLSSIYNSNFSNANAVIYKYNDFINKLIAIHPKMKHYFHFKLLKKMTKNNLNKKNQKLNRNKLKYLPVTKIFRFINFILLILIALVISSLILKFNVVNISQDYGVIFSMISLIFVQILISKAIRLFN